MAMNEVLSIQGDLGAKQVLTWDTKTLAWQEGDLSKSWPLGELEEVKLHHYVGSLTINATFKDGKELVLLRGSQGLARQYQQFCQAINDHLQDKTTTIHEQEAADRCPKCSRFYPDPARPICPRCLDKRSLSKRVLGLVPPYLKQIVLMVALMLA